MAMYAFLMYQKFLEVVIIFWKFSEIVESQCLKENYHATERNKESEKGITRL